MYKAEIREVRRKGMADRDIETERDRNDASERERDVVRLDSMWMS